MRRKNNLYFVLAYCLYGAFLPGASDASAPFSKYGVIQNVQNYSSNPFWNPNSAYNQRMPQPVYATGPQVQTDDCQRTVASLVAVQCHGRNNCANTQLSDIRPAIMVQLSRMSNGNYATSCSGYIDGAFNDYIRQNKNTTTTLNPNAQFPTPQQLKETALTNRNTRQEVPDWESERAARIQELSDIEFEMGTNSANLTSGDFPMTYADFSFKKRVENETAGYAPYKDAKAYHGINIESLETYGKRQNQEEEAERKAFCKEQLNKIKDSTDLPSKEIQESCPEELQDYCDTLDTPEERIQKLGGFCKNKEDEDKEKCNKLINDIKDGNKTTLEPDEKEKCKAELNKYCEETPTAPESICPSATPPTQPEEEEDEEGSFYLLFQPNKSSLQNGTEYGYKSDEIEQEDDFFNTNCSDNKYNWSFNHNDAISSKLKVHELTEYTTSDDDDEIFLSSDSMATAAYKPKFHGVLSYYINRSSPHGKRAHEVFTNTLKKAKFLAQKIATELEGTACSGLKIYVFTYPKVGQYKSTDSSRIIIKSEPYEIKKTEN